MENLSGSGRGIFAVQQWQELRKGGGVAIPPEQIKELLANKRKEPFSREELISTVSDYFASCQTVTINEETGEEIRLWTKTPTKSGLALRLGVTPQCLLDYVKGSYGGGNTPYRSDSISTNGLRKVRTEDFDVLRTAYTVIESFFEDKLSENRNVAGVIYWLNNSARANWANDQTVTLDAVSKVQNGPEITRQEIASKYNAVLLPPESAEDVL